MIFFLLFIVLALSFTRGGDPGLWIVHLGRMSVQLIFSLLLKLVKLFNVSGDRSRYEGQGFYQMHLK